MLTYTSLHKYLMTTVGFLFIQHVIAHNIASDTIAHSATAQFTSAALGASMLGLPAFIYRKTLFSGYLPTIGPAAASVGGAITGVTALHATNIVALIKSNYTDHMLDQAPYLVAATTGAATLGIPAFLHRKDLFLGYLPTMGPIAASIGGALAGIGAATLPKNSSIKAIYLVGIDSIDALTDAWDQLMQIGAFAPKIAEHLPTFKKTADDYVTIVSQNDVNQALNQTNNHLPSDQALDKRVTKAIATKQDSSNDGTLHGQNHSTKNTRSFHLISYTDLNNARNNKKIDITHNQFAQLNRQIVVLNKRMATLDQRVTSLNMQIQKNNKRVIHGIASAAALSQTAIPMPDKAIIEAGVSRYEQAQALAIMVSYRPTSGAMNVQGGIAATIGSRPAVRVGTNYEF